MAELFDSKYMKNIDGKMHLDLSLPNYDILLDFGIPAGQIEVSPLCSFEENDLLHSYRREGKISGRALGIIAMKGE